MNAFDGKAKVGFMCVTHDMKSCEVRVPYMCELVFDTSLLQSTGDKVHIYIIFDATVSYVSNICLTHMRT